MPVIAIVSPSVRKGRYSHRAALYFKNFLEEKNLSAVEMLDLFKYNFPLFDERLKYLESPSAEIVDFGEKVRAADGIIIITPEYNGGYPASLKNAIDLLYDEWHRKPIAFVTVSEGNAAGAQVITSIQFVLWKMGAQTIPFSFRIPNIRSTFDENGTPADKSVMDKRASAFIKELLWYIDAKKRMSEL